MSLRARRRRPANEWGREESADTLSRGGRGEFLHGLVPLPEWLDLGGDLRLAALANETGSSEGTELAAFPMQADVAAAVKLGSWSVIGSVGLKGSARQAGLSSGSSRQEAGAASRLISREHYVYWRPKARGPYARAGRFYAPFGLRLPDHTTYVRRYTGFNLLEETYGLNAGLVQRRRELHVTLFVSDELRWSPRREAGGALSGELRTSSSAFGLSARAAVGQANLRGDLRATGGLYYKHSMEGLHLLWLAEADGTFQRFEDLPGASRWQIAAYVGPVWNPLQGLCASIAYELFDEDVLVRNVERHAASMWVSLLPRSHVEIMLSGRAQVIGSADHALTGMVQLHYYL